MPQERDPYVVLGVSPDATAGELRTAFRKAAVRWHPDSTHDDPAAAEAKIRELIGAYQTAMGLLAATSGGGRRTYSPSDFARHGYGGGIAAANVALDPEELRREIASLWSKRKAATRNEPVWFAVFWIVAVLMGIAVGFYIGIRSLPEDPDARPDTWHIVLMIALAEVIYAAIAVAAIYLILLTRKLIKLTIRFATHRWHALPTPAQTPAATPPQPPADTPADGEASAEG